MLFARQSFLVAGLSRSGVSAAEFLLARGASVYLYDDVEEGATVTAASLLCDKGGKLLKKEGVFEKIEQIDVLVLSPGIPVDHPLPVAFKKAGKRILGEAELGVLGLRANVLAVTGTNGKTTTVTLIDEILRAAGEESVACGNIGKPITSCSSLPENGFAVAEISSFQLETLSSLRPHVAAILNVTEDHLNRHYNMENYLYLKGKILKNQTESEYAVLNYDDSSVRPFAQKSKGKVVWFSLRERVDGAYRADGGLYYFGERICDEQALALGGSHNVANALAALAVCKLVGVKNEVIARVLGSFKGVKHRIERIGEADGVTFINDSKATNVASAVKAVESVKGETVLLVGGKDKGYSYEPLFEALPSSSVVHTVIYGENAFKILACALKKGYTALTLCQPFDLAVKVAYFTARKGQNVLLSPASASFDQFSGYEERGERFCELFELIKAQSGAVGEVAVADGSFEE